MIDAPHCVINIVRPIPPRWLFLEHCIEPFDDLCHVAFRERAKIFGHGLLDDFLGFLGWKSPDCRFGVGYKGDSSPFAQKQLLDDCWQDSVEVDIQAGFVQYDAGTAHQAFSGWRF